MARSGNEEGFCNVPVRALLFDLEDFTRELIMRVQPLRISRLRRFLRAVYERLNLEVEICDPFIDRCHLEPLIDKIHKLQ
jgi:hypothetical protein